MSGQQWPFKYKYVIQSKVSKNGKQIFLIHYLDKKSATKRLYHQLTAKTSKLLSKNATCGNQWGEIPQLYKVKKLKHSTNQTKTEHNYSLCKIEQEDLHSNKLFSPLFKQMDKRDLCDCDEVVQVDSKGSPSPLAGLSQRADGWTLRMLVEELNSFMGAGPTTSTPGKWKPESKYPGNRSRKWCVQGKVNSLCTKFTQWIKMNR